MGEWGSEERRTKSKRSHLSSSATDCLISGDCFPRSHVSWPQESQPRRGEEVKESVHQHPSPDGQHFSLWGFNSPASPGCTRWGPLEVTWHPRPQHQPGNAKLRGERHTVQIWAQAIQGCTWTRPAEVHAELITRVLGTDVGEAGGD